MDGSSFFTVRLCCNDRYGGDVSACTCSFFNIDLESNVWLLSIRHYDCWLYSFYNTAWFCTAQCDLWWNRGDHRRSEEHTSELQSRFDLVCRLLLEKKKINTSEMTRASK